MTYLRCAGVKRRINSVLEVDLFHIKTGSWQQQLTNGPPPRGVVSYSCVAAEDDILYFGGYCGHGICYHNDITRLSTEHFNWEKIMSSKTDGEGPMQKASCGMVGFTTPTGEKYLHIVGGVGTLPSTPPHQFKYTSDGTTNEEHIFSLKTSKEERRL